MVLPLRVTVDPERADAAPGDTLTFDVTVRNASDIVEHYGVEMLGLPDGATVRADPEVAKLRPTETATLTVRVTLPEQPSAPAGTYVLGALVRSKYRHDVSRCVEVPVDLATVERISVHATPEVVTGGRTGQYTVEVTNGGNAPVRLHLSATDPEGRVSSAFQPSSVDLVPGATMQTLLSVSAPLPWNREKQQHLTLTAAPDIFAVTGYAGVGPPGVKGAPDTAAGSGTVTFVQRPRFASKLAKVAGIAAAVLLLAAAVAVPTLLNRAANEPDAAPQATAAAPGAPPAPAASAAPGAAPSAAAPASAAGPSAAAPGPAAPSADTPSAAPSEPVGGLREVDLTAPPGAAVDTVLSSDVFRSEGFLAGGDPGSGAAPGCEDAKSATVRQDGTGKRFLTSAHPDDATRCNAVPLMIDFLPDGPAGEVQVDPLTAEALEMEVVYRDLSRDPEPDLKADGSSRGGIDFVVLRLRAGAPVTDPVAVTSIRFAPLDG